MNKDILSNIHFIKWTKKRAVRTVQAIILKGNYNLYYLIIMNTKNNSYIKRFQANKKKKVKQIVRKIE